jgi:hypothetical protein
MAGRRENVQDWLAVDAGLRELVLYRKFPVNREKYREIAALVPGIRRYPQGTECFSANGVIFGPIGTENYQGMNRELKFPVN